MVDGDGGAQGCWATTRGRSFSELNIAGMETEGRGDVGRDEITRGAMMSEGSFIL